MTIRFKIWVNHGLCARLRIMRNLNPQIMNLSHKNYRDIVITHCYFIRIKLHAGNKKCHFGRALLVRPSRIPRWISKIIFALGSYEFLAMLEGKTRKGLFF